MKNDTNPGYFYELVRNFERELIFQELVRNHWEQTKTAISLGISYRGLRHKIKTLGIKRDL